MEAYRSGHNGPDSKSGRRQRLVGSNPTRSATPAGEQGTQMGSLLLRFIISCGCFYCVAPPHAHLPNRRQQMPRTLFLSFLNNFCSRRSFRPFGLSHYQQNHIALCLQVIMERLFIKLIKRERCFSFLRSQCQFDAKAFWNYGNTLNEGSTFPGREAQPHPLNMPKRLF